ncbi:hypothetical protein [Brachybacterium muris]|uniref:hypothetical protein n=1 Tax=Brachybacterium muris TaxID=219301 RepID=UPI00223ABA8C|nr:hypothetical protein [Brachybacterium muris]MCT1653666.1 hypothetical protein [Brachybacterium muris]
MTEQLNPVIHAHLWRHKDGRPPEPGAMIRKGGGFIFIPHHQLIATATALADIYETQETP